MNTLSLTTVLLSCSNVWTNFLVDILPSLKFFSQVELKSSSSLLSFYLIPHILNISGLSCLNVEAKESWPRNWSTQRPTQTQRYTVKKMVNGFSTCKLLLTSRVENIKVSCTALFQPIGLYFNRKVFSAAHLPLKRLNF